MNKQLLLEWLKKTDIPLTTISKKTRVSRKTIYNWINGGKMGEKSFSKVLNVYANDIKLINTNIDLKSGENMEAKYIIDLQKEKIERLEQDLMRHKSTPIQETLWNQLEFDFQCEVKLTFEYFTMGRNILSITNAELQSKILGYSVNELEKLWDIGTHYKNSEKHPINKLLNNHTLKGIQERIKSLPQIFEQLKNMMGNHYIPQPLTYVCKDKSLVNAIAYNKVNWKEKTVSTKVKFLLND